MKRKYLIIAFASTALGVLVALLVARTNLPVAAFAGSDSQKTRDSQGKTRQEAEDRDSDGTVTRTPPPRFVASDVPRLKNNPSAEGYDPIALFDAESLPPKTFFVAEPRDPDWAPGMETRLLAITRQDVDSLGTSVKVHAVECRRMTCNIVLTAENMTDLRQGIMRLNYTPLGNLQSSEPALRDTKAPFSTGYVVMWTPEERGVDFQNRNYPEDRRRSLAKSRALKHDWNPPLPEQ